MGLPDTYTDINETGCCAVPNIAAWNEKELEMNDQRFIRMHTKSFLHVPLNMAKVMAAIQKKADKAGATMPPKKAMILSRELSPWKAEQLYAVNKEVEGADTIVLNGVFLTKVFEGPYKNANKWYKSLVDFVKSKGATIDKTYFFYTTCPKCARHYGKNYVIGLAKTKRTKQP